MKPPGWPVITDAEASSPRRFRIIPSRDGYICYDLLQRYEDWYFVGFGATPKAAFDDCCIDREMFDDPDLHK